MNQKDYKAIAKIIAKETSGLLLKGSFLHLCSALADYFEKEQLHKDHCGNIITENKFNRQQFIKDCRVDEK
jgi:hypothetical protein